MNTDDVSISSISFFCMSALPNPLSMNTLLITINTLINAIKPKSDGSNNRARIMETIKLTVWELIF